MKKLIIALIVIIIIGLGAYFFSTRTADAPEDVATTTPTTTGATTTVETGDETSIGLSDEGRELPIYHYGEGDTEVLFVGGIHGGYEWNTTLLAYELMDHLDENPDEIPDGVKVSVIPVLNPDGLNK